MGIDRQSFRLLLLIFGAVVIMCLAGIIGLAANDTDVPTVLELTLTGTITGLLGLFVQAPHGTQPINANIVNPTGDPVKTEEQH